MFLVELHRGIDMVISPTEFDVFVGLQQPDGSALPEAILAFDRAREVNST